jgi:hypothetical protein
MPRALLLPALPGDASSPRAEYAVDTDDDSGRGVDASTSVNES